jgi:aspartyl-tRNA(Asn)/glutamyl-tRNA(Gln) amidotransferase subunit B
MQEGSLRCDANVSLRPRGATTLGTRAEIKNLNSFRFIEQAIEHEIARQAQVLESGRKVAQETRLYDPDAQETRPLRGKEEAQDYRYFPDPDLLPIELSSADVERIRASMPMSRDATMKYFSDEYGLSMQHAEKLTADPATSLYFSKGLEGFINPKMVATTTANLVLRDLAAFLHREGIGIAESPIPAKDIVKLAERINDETVSANAAVHIFPAIAAGEGDTDTVIHKRGLRQESDTGVLAGYVDQVIAANADQVAEYRTGKDKVLGFLVGQVMKLSGGKANPQQVNALLREKLGR